MFFIHSYTLLLLVLLRNNKILYKMPVGGRVAGKVGYSSNYGNGEFFHFTPKSVQILVYVNTFLNFTKDLNNYFFLTCFFHPQIIWLLKSFV